jgi:beta-glucanase (GH16 family)
MGGERTQQRRRGRRVVPTLLAALVVIGGLALDGGGTAGAAPALTGAGAVGACGPAVPKTKTTSWQCTLAENFDGTQLDTRLWTPLQTQVDGYQSGGDACYVNNPKNVKVQNGSLHLTAREEASPFLCFATTGGLPLRQHTSGSVSTVHKFSQAYGRFEIRAKLPVSSPMTFKRGNQFSFWLWPQNPAKYGSHSGEIDIMEWYSLYEDRGIPFMHYLGDDDDATKTNNVCLFANPAGWHTFTLEWTPQVMKVIYDGKVCLTNTSWSPSTGKQPAPFDHPFFINLTQALGIGTNAFDHMATPLPATTMIDYVYVWK